MQKYRAVIGHSYWGRGGAEAVGMWVIEALKDVLQFDILTRGGWDLDELNLCAGTNVKQSDIGQVICPPWVPQNVQRGGSLWHSLFLRYCRTVGGQYSVCLTASGQIDWGRGAIHFLSDVVWNPALLASYGDDRAQTSTSWLRAIFRRVGVCLAPSALGNQYALDTHVANSFWTAKVSADFCSRPPVVIYPPVYAPLPETVWVAREISFLCLGRVTPEKHVERIISILAALRGDGHPCILHIVGGSDDSRYHAQISSLCQQHGEWIILHGALYGREKRVVMGLCRYGISACQREAFGMATAEMTKSGIPVFVPREGAQSEIVENEELLFSGEDECLTKLKRVLESSSLQQRLHASALVNGARFDSDSFCDSVRALVVGRLG